MRPFIIWWGSRSYSGLLVRARYVPSVLFVYFLLIAFVTELLMGVLFFWGLQSVSAEPWTLPKRVGSSAREKV